MTVTIESLFETLGSIFDTMSSDDVISMDSLSFCEDTQTIKLIVRSHLTGYTYATDIRLEHDEVLISGFDSVMVVEFWHDAEDLEYRVLSVISSAVELTENNNGNIWDTDPDD